VQQEESQGATEEEREVEASAGEVRRR